MKVFGLECNVERGAEVKGPPAELAERDELSNALDLTEREVADWKQKFDALVASESNDPATARSIRAGSSAPDELDHAVDEVKAALRRVPVPVREAI